MAKLEQKIIKLLSDYPEREFYGQEIARKVGCSKASASGILKLLYKKKMVFKKTKGRMQFYQIDQKNSEVKRFKINAVMERLNPLLPKLKKFSQKIILFGSASRGEQSFGSDIDLFILSNNKNGMRAFLKKINRGLDIKAIIKTPGEWSEMEVKEPEFYQEIKSGITLYNYVPRI
jgi:predicted nucleotidyltransferase